MFTVATIGGGRLMIRLGEFFKMSEGNMRDFLVGKKVYNQDKILEELGILGYITSPKSVLFKKLIVMVIEHMIQTAL